MSSPSLNQLDRDVIESVLQMGSGYVLEFSDRTFADVFRDFCVQIDDGRYRVDGDSKARRLRVFLRTASPELAAKVLDALRERRLLKLPDGVNQSEVDRYRAIVQRLGGQSTRGASVGHPSAPDSESELLKRVFRPELLPRLLSGEMPVDAAERTVEEVA